MKKLMITAAAVAMTAGAFAAPEVYNYKASVKHMYLKSVSARVAGATITAYQKYQKSASLKGYLIQDCDGATSQRIQAFDVTTPYAAVNAATGFDYGCNRAFLVVQNSAAETAVRRPKLLPAVLDAKWIDTAWARQHQATSGLAEGYLFVGGDSIACVRTQLDYNALTDTIVDRGAAPAAPAAATDGMTAYSDYLWTSVYLFGQFNGPNWFVTSNPQLLFETAWDAGLHVDLRIAYAAGRPFYHDTWMNGSGIGKWTSPSGDLCCGLMPSQAQVLDSLSGNLKGGIFICTENGIDPNNNAYVAFDNLEWEDQFFTARLIPGATFADTYQLDMWQDGAVEQETTDVVYGTWSIKRCTSNFFSPTKPKNVALTDTEKDILKGAAAAGGENAVGLEILCETIKGAALDLNSKTVFARAANISTMKASNRFDVPLLTTNFAKYYGLGDWK